jgi:hypothetical protein
MLMIPPLLSLRLLAGAFPESTVRDYYGAINKGDLTALRKEMADSSYTMTLSALALSKALKDPAFRKRLKQIDRDPEALKEAERYVTEKLKTRPPRRIGSLKTCYLTPEKAVVNFLEEGKKKKLYLRRIGGEWRVDYSAGRPPSQ